MILNEFQQVSYSSFRKINRFLRRNFGFVIQENASKKELEAIVNESRKAVFAIRENNQSFNKDENYTKHLMLAEGAEMLLSLRETTNTANINEVATDIMAEYVIKQIAAGQAPVNALNEAYAMVAASDLPFVAEDLYASTLSALTENDRMKKEPIKRTLWDLLPDDKKEKAKDVFDRLKKTGEAPAWDLAGMGDDDRGYEQFIDPSIRRKPEQKIAATNTNKQAAAAQMIKPSSALSTAMLEPMKESTMKRLKKLTENRVEQAEVIAAARGFVQQLQNMIEKVGRLQNEDLGPVIDEMRLSFGNDVAAQFYQVVEEKLQVILDQMKTAREGIDVAVGDIAEGHGIQTDMDKPVDLDSDDLDAEIDADLDDEFAGDVAAAGPEDAPLGREKKESIQIKRLANMLAEAEQKLSNLRALSAKKK